MSRYAYRILNVFAESVLAGNPLCVFEDATGLSDVEMQALALQFNLSETTGKPSSAAEFDSGGLPARDRSRGCHW